MELSGTAETVIDVNIAPLRNVDILFVIDNSGSTAAEQANLAANLAPMIERLEDEHVAADYRIAVTTTDVADEACVGTGPEDGKFIATSCRARVEDFLTPANFVPLNALHSGVGTLAQPSCRLGVLESRWREKSMPTLLCTSATQMLDELHLLQSVRGSGNWFFRGQANRAWALEPSLFRLRMPRDAEKRFEADLLGHLRAHLTDRSLMPAHLLEDDDHLLSLAQHYGAPTRLLDWSRAPLAAAYFAASGAVANPDAEYFAVFAIADIIQISTRVEKSSLIHPPSGANQNLAAQGGVLMKHDWDQRDLWEPRFDAPTHSSAKSVSTDIDSRFIRLDLPRAKAPAMCSELGRRGVDAVSLFPGWHGFALAARDFANTTACRRTAAPGPDDDDDLG